MATVKSYLPVFPGFYGTHFEPNYELAIEDNYTYDDYEWDNAGYESDMSKAAVNAVDNKLNELGFNLDIKFDNLYSPKFYNFSNDSINVTYTLKAGCIGAIKQYLIDNAAAFEQYLKDNFTSVSGFISFYSNKVKDWNPITVKWLQADSVYIGAILEFVLQNEGFDSLELYYRCEDVSIYGELLPQSFTVDGVMYSGKEDELLISHQLNPYINGVWERVTFAEWLTQNAEVIPQPEPVNPNQLLLF